MFSFVVLYIIWYYSVKIMSKFTSNNKRQKTTHCFSSSSNNIDMDMTTLLTNHIRVLKGMLIKVANKEKAPQMKKYLKNQFDMLGVSSPERKLIHNEFRKSIYQPKEAIELLEYVRLLFKESDREFQYIAIDELDKSKKLLAGIELSDLEELIQQKAWWDTVDIFAANIIGKNYKEYILRDKQLNPDFASKYGYRWIASDNMWLNRTAMLIQLSYKNDTSIKFLTDAIEPHLDSKEFFHQKAIGWVLRQYSKTDREWVSNYIDVNRSRLKPLSIREGSKYI